MKPLKGYNEAQASGDFERLAPGGYVIKIQAVQDNEDKQYLKILFDIAEGPERGRYKNEDAEHDYRHSFVRSYKEKALGMFKAFIRAIDESNGTNFNDNIENKGLVEQQLVGKILGATIGYEEYEANDGNVKERMRITSCIPAEKVRKGEFKVPELKKLKESTTSTSTVPAGFTPLSDEDVPF